jgi:hypothetical protein
MSRVREMKASRQIECVKLSAKSFIVSVERGKHINLAEIYVRTCFLVDIFKTPFNLSKFLTYATV